MHDDEKKVPKNAAQITLYLQDNGAIDCQTEWHFPKNTQATDQEVDTLITLIHGLSGYIHTRFYEVFKMGEAIEAGLRIKEQILERHLFPDDQEIFFEPDPEFLEKIENNKKKANGKAEKNGKENNIVDIQDFISSKDPKKLN